MQKRFLAVCPEKKNAVKADVGAGEDEEGTTSATGKFRLHLFSFTATSSFTSLLSLPLFPHSALDCRNARILSDMAPTKAAATEKGEKEVKLTPEQSAALMLEYLRKQNRPYSATDISSNLKNRVTKAAATKLLKDMHERGDIEGKAAGKQIVYHAIQVSERSLRLR